MLLPAVLDENPFDISDSAIGSSVSEAESTSSGRGKHSPYTLGGSQVTRLIDVLEIVVELLNSSMLHPNISLQLLSNLLFFTNASLFNTLMEEESGKRFYW